MGHIKLNIFTEKLGHIKPYPEFVDFVEKMRQIMEKCEKNLQKCKSMYEAKNISDGRSAKRDERRLREGNIERRRETEGRHK
jgi:hypothetical protein